MTKNIKPVIVLILFAFQFFIGCNNSFDPVVAGNYDDLILFLVLDNRSTSQFAYVQKVYQDTSERKNIHGLELWLSEKDGSSYKFRDTAINNNNFKIYYLPDIKLNQGSIYQFSAVIDSSVKDQASINIPCAALSKGLIYYYEDPFASKTTLTAKGKIYFSKDFLGSKNNFYHKFRAYVEYEKVENGYPDTKFREINYSVEFNPNVQCGGGNSLTPTFLDIEEECLRPEGISEFTKIKIDSFTFNNLSILYAFQFLSDRTERKSVTIKRAFVVVYTVDEYFYDNFIGINWDEVLSARFDTRSYSPDLFTHSDKIMGVFGAISADTMDIPIDDKLIQVWGYNNGQK